MSFGRSLRNLANKVFGTPEAANQNRRPDMRFTAY